MAELPEFTEELIRSACTAESFARGVDYFRQGAIYHPARRGNILAAECAGSSAPAYRVQVELDAAGIRQASCTCPYDWGGYCKHIVALLLTYVHHPQDFSEREEIADILANLDREGLIALIEKLAGRDAELYDQIEALAQAVSTRPKTGQARTAGKHPTQVSEQAFRRQISSILGSLDRLSSSEAYWEMGGMIEQLEAVRDSAGDFMEARDAQGALIILRVLLEEVFDEYENFDDSDGELSDFLDSLGLPLAEAILSADLEEDERVELGDELRTAWEDLMDYGMEGLEVAVAAAALGRVEVETELEEDEDWDEDWEAEDDTEEYESGEWSEEALSELNEARLNVLERQGPEEEYLAMCQKLNRTRRYILKLMELGREDDAVQAAKTELTCAGDALEVAIRLRELNLLEDAVAIGERGLSLSGEKYSLGNWLGPVEEAQGRVEQAFQAYHAAFYELPSIELYRSLKRLAGARWDEIQPRLVEIMRARGASSSLVDVYLAEGQWDAALRIADEQPGNYRLLEKVADAVIEHRPGWVIRVSRGQAEELIERTQSKYYPVAGRWLAKMKKAYQQQGQAQEWQKYLDGLRMTYSRRPALQSVLRGL